MGPRAPLGFIAPTSANSLTALFPFGGCPPWGCGGSNSPWMGDNIVFHELYSGPLRKENDAGLSLGHARAESSERMNLSVEGHHLVGRTVSTHHVLRGKQLIGSQFDLILATTEGGNRVSELYILCIVDVDEDGLRFWTGAEQPVPVYWFSFRKESDREAGWRSLCVEDAREWESIQATALVFEGDRYDADQKRVLDPTPLDGTRWFNVACAGTTVAKMHLLRHTTAGSLPPEIDTSRQQRQTMLKMLAADYCGTGEPFTRRGQPLSYAYDQQWIGPAEANPGLPRSIEAIWDAGGALCVETPRLDYAPAIDTNGDRVTDAADNDRFTGAKRSGCRFPNGMPTCTAWLGERGLDVNKIWPRPGQKWGGPGYAISANP